jgi:hypothetical protein
MMFSLIVIDYILVLNINYLDFNDSIAQGEPLDILEDIDLLDVVMANLDKKNKDDRDIMSIATTRKMKLKYDFIKLPTFEVIHTYHFPGIIMAKVIPRLYIRATDDHNQSKTQSLTNKHNFCTTSNMPITEKGLHTIEIKFNQHEKDHLLYIYIVFCYKIGYELSYINVIPRYMVALVPHIMAKKCRRLVHSRW